MKYIWEESDIKGGAKVVNDQECKADLCIGWSRDLNVANASPVWGIFYINTDGLFLHLGTKEKVADYLNKYKYKPAI